MPFFKQSKKPNIWSKTSYSQSGEDLIVKFIFDALGIINPSYLDIGAHHPFYLSNTALLYELGSRGINIEPDPTLFKTFLKDRALDKNINMGVGMEKADVDFYIISVPTLNTFSRKEAERYIDEGDYQITDVVKIPVDCVQNIIDKYNTGVFPHFLNIDAEGVDELIVKSIDYEKNYPIVICIETLTFSTSGNGLKNTAIIDFLLKNNYLLYADTNINSVFVKKDLWQKKL